MGNRKTASVPFQNPQNDPVAAATHIYAGNIVCLDASGNAVAGSATTGLVARGISQEEVDNSDGSAGDLSIRSHTGCFLLDNSESDAVTAAEVGDVCYIESAIAVCKTGTGKSVAGVVERIDSSGQVVVNVGKWPLSTGLLAANNLSDVGSAATARSNIGANKTLIRLGQVSTKAADSGVLYGVVPEYVSAGTIKKLVTVLNNALATADATVQLQYGANAGALANVGSTTTGKVTQTQSGSAAGDVDVASPATTNIAVAGGGLLKAVVAGGSTATGTCEVSVEIEY